MANFKINLSVNAYYDGVKVLDGNQYRITIHWNTYTEKWYMRIQGLNNDIDVAGIALLPGKDLLAAYGLQQLGQLWMVDQSNGDTNPTYADIGSRYVLEYTTRD